MWINNTDFDRNLFMRARILVVLLCISGVMGLGNNLVLKLMQEFGKLQSLTSITTCLSVPKSSKNPIQWGILAPSSSSELTDISIIQDKMCHGLDQ